MHIIIGLHSLPGGVNTLGIGEAFGHNAWFFNTTNLDYSFRAVDSVLNFIKASGRQYAFTIAPINEPSDNFAGFATLAGLTTNGTNWINTYMNGVLARIAKVDKRVPLMLQDAFFSEQYWSPFFPAGTNMVIDSHIYFFAASGAYSQYIAPAICGQAKYVGQGDGKFPVFIGEWSLQSLYNNTLAYRKTLYDTQVYAYQKYASGSAFWNLRMLNDVDTAVISAAALPHDNHKQIMIRRGFFSLTPTLRSLRSSSSAFSRLLTIQGEHVGLSTPPATARSSDSCNSLRCFSCATTIRIKFRCPGHASSVAPN